MQAKSKIWFTVLRLLIREKLKHCGVHEKLEVLPGFEPGFREGERRRLCFKIPSDNHYTIAPWILSRGGIIAWPGYLIMISSKEKVISWMFWKKYAKERILIESEGAFRIFSTCISTFMGSFPSIGIPIGMGACLVGAIYYCTF
jgi:hypothetical protein